VVSGGSHALKNRRRGGGNRGGGGREGKNKVGERGVRIRGGIRKTKKKPSLRDRQQYLEGRGGEGGKKGDGAPKQNEERNIQRKGGSPKNYLLGQREGKGLPRRKARTDRK